MATKHTVNTGESLLSIAKYYGFGSTKPIEDHPDNQALLAERGEEGLQLGDELTIPGGRSGETERGTGRGHQLTVRRIPKLFEVRVFTELRKENLQTRGFKDDKPQNTWLAFGDRGITELSAKVEVKLLYGINSSMPNPQGGMTNRKTGMFTTTSLWRGKWQVKLTPTADQLSSGPAKADPTGDHGRGFYKSRSQLGTTDSDGHAVPPPLKAYPGNRNFEVEYRPLTLEVEVNEHNEIFNAKVSTPLQHSRPHHAVLFWKNLEYTDNKQVLEIDWKPDFMRRVVGQCRPRHRVRSTNIDLIMFHHTAGLDIGSALFAFFSENHTSGAQFLVDLDGHVIRLADDRYVTKHGGGGRETRTPSWRGSSVPTINQRAIGIEHVHKDLSLDKTSLAVSIRYSDAQYLATIDLITGLKATYNVTAADVIGHSDVVAKAMCPGRMVDWPRLEAAGVSLAPAALTPNEIDAMFGGFFAGPIGATRQLTLGDSEQEINGRFHVHDKGGDPIAEDLSSGPIAHLREAIRQVGYSVEEWIVVDHVKHRLTAATRKKFEKTLGYALGQFVRHYATGARLRPDLYFAYRDSPRVWNEVFVDIELAKIIQGLMKAAIAVRGPI